MASKIEWTDATWNPISGCKRVSDGCTRCYAERMARRLSRLPLYAGVTKGTPSGPRWTGEVGVGDGKVWTQPLRWRKPRRIFVCSMTDLFYEGHDVREVARVFGVMLACHALGMGHTFQVLTKRANRMRTLMGMNDDSFRAMAREHAVALLPDEKIAAGVNLGVWPLPNIWLGVSVEDQQRADERIPALVETPAVIRFLSVEPLLGPVDLSHLLGCSTCELAARGRRVSLPTPFMERGKRRHAGNGPFTRPCTRGIHQVITGGESGPGARPCHPDWLRSLRDQCQASGTSYLLKQHGAWREGGFEPAEEHEPWCTYLNADGTGGQASISTMDAETWTNWTGPGPGNGMAWMERVGKKAAGRELDGRTWDEFPEVLRA